MINWFYVVVLGVAVGVVSAMYDWPFSVSISIIVIFALYSIGYMYYIAFASTNMKQIKKYIVKHQKDPMLNYILVLENGTKEEEIEAMNRVIDHYKQPVIIHTYKMNRAIRIGDFELADQFADKLTDTPNGTYGKASIAALLGNRDEARNYPLKKEWMEHAVEAQLAFAENNIEAFEQFAAKAVERAKGLQRFTLYHSFKKAKLEQEWEN